MKFLLSISAFLLFCMFFSFNPKHSQANSITIRITDPMNKPVSIVLECDLIKIPTDGNGVLYIKETDLEKYKNKSFRIKFKNLPDYGAYKDRLYFDTTKNSRNRSLPFNSVHLNQLTLHCSDNSCQLFLIYKYTKLDD